jgi:hypothetical protein
MSYIGKVDQWHNEPIEQHETENDVDLCPPWDDEWITNDCDLDPVEGKDAHPQTGTCAEQGVDRLVGWLGPTDKRESAQEQHEIPCAVSAKSNFNNVRYTYQEAKSKRSIPP